MKSIFTVFLVLCCATSFSQNFASMFSIELKGKEKETMVFQAVNKKTNEATLFLADKQRINAIQLSDKMTFKDSLSSKRPNKIFKNIIGYGITSKKTTVFWSTENFATFLLQTFDFENRTSDIKSVEFPSDRETIIQVFSINENFYILSFLKATNALQLTCFDDKNESKVIVLDTNKINPSVVNLLLATTISNDPLEKIADDGMVFFTESLKKNKCYSNENQIVISFDVYAEKTILLLLDLKQGTLVENAIAKPVGLEDNVVYHNSFVFDDKIAQIVGSKKNIIISIKDFNSNVIKEFSSVTNPSLFDSQKYFNENTIGTAHPIADKKDFLKWLDAATFGFTCYKTTNNYVVSIGKPIPLAYDSESGKMGKTEAYMMYGGMIGGFTGALIGLALSNPGQQSFVSSMNNGRMYFNFWMDTNCNEVPVKFSDLAVEKVRKFIKGRASEPGQTVFSVNNSVYLGSYNKNEKRYFIRKFTD